MKIAPVLLVLALALPAAAQAPAPGEPETIYSDAQRLKDELLSRKFVQSLLRPSYNLEGQFSRWKIPVCPHLVGMTPLAAHVVEKRIRDVAGQVGVSLDRRDPCRPNIVVFVTPQPQVLLQAIAAKEPLLFDGAPPRELTVHYPVQSWYFGYFIDSAGVAHWDVDCWLHPIDPECTPGAAADDTRLKTGMRAEMHAATILVDSAAVNGMTLGELGDYLALMALAQATATGRCQPAPSIANLFLTNCDADFHVTSLSDADLAMLTALYQTPEEPEKLQMMRLMANMRHNLEGGK